MAWFVVFAVIVFALWFWRDHRVQQRHNESASAPHRTGERYIGQVITVAGGIENGAGRTTLNQKDWSLRGPDIPAGGKARVTGVDGQILIVDRVAA